MDLATTVLQTSGLESPQLTAVLLVVAGALLLWGFERYRTTFSKTEFGVAVALALGVGVVALVPDVFGRLGAALHIEQRPLVVALAANVTLLVLVLMLFVRTRANQMTIGELTRSLTIEQAESRDDLDGDVAFVVIPAYNEAPNVRAVVDSLPERVGGYAIQPLVVSDGSTDGTTAAVADTRAMVVEHPINQGQGGALQTGFDIAREHDADVVVTMDADGQHPVDQLGDLLGPIERGEADYVVGSRFIGEDRTDNSMARQSGIRVFTALINAITKLEVTDCTNGFRAIRGDALDAMTLTEERFSAPELLIEARKKGLRVEEVPVRIDERAVGETKKPQLGYAIGLTRTIFVTWLR